MKYNLFHREINIQGGAHLLIGNRIKLLRESRGLQQQELCSIIGVEQSTLANYENNRRIPSDEVKIKLADYFNVTIDYLLGRDTPETKKDPSAEESKMVNEISDIYDKLSDEAKEKLLEYCSDLLGNPKNLK